MNYLVMDRASDTVAHDLAEVRKLIEGMTALVSQQQQQQAHQHTSDSSYLTSTNDPNAAVFAAAAAAMATTAGSSSSLTAATPAGAPGNFGHAPAITSATASTGAQSSVPSSSVEAQSTATSNNASATAASGTAPDAIVIQVDHLLFNQTRYFQLTADATIEPLIAWLRVVFGDNSVSGMVLQYKGYDGLWKCLLNRDDSLRRVLKQALKNKEKAPVPPILQMRVPREQDLLSSGYTDRRLIALTKPGA